MELAQAATDLLAPLGFEVLELTVGGRGSKKRVLLRIDRLDGKPVSMEDITLVTETFSLELDRLDPFEDEYTLEVESPGPERPLIHAHHFARFHDLQAKVRVGGDSFKGTIRKVENGYVTFEVDGDMREIALGDIQSARLAEWPDSPR